MCFIGLIRKCFIGSNVLTKIKEIPFWKRHENNFPFLTELCKLAETHWTVAHPLTLYGLFLWDFNLSYKKKMSEKKQIKKIPHLKSCMIADILYCAW